MKRQTILLSLFLAGLLGDETVFGQRMVVVTPEETDEILANPAVGWETFHRTSRQDRNLPSWIPSTIHYARWGWSELEPQPGKINTAFLDKTLRETHDAGQKLAFRVMCCSTTRGAPYHPAWLKQIGGRELHGRVGSSSFRSPIWTIPPSRTHISTSSCGWENDTTAMPASTTSTWVPSAGGANGT